jgi:hypothetical protein
MQKAKVKKGKAPKKAVTLTIEDVPIAVHNRIKRYRMKITGRDNKKYRVMQAYAEFLKEYSKLIRL